MQEFQAALKNLSYSKETLEGIFDSLDVNQNGRINWTEFLAATIEAAGHIQEERIAEAFDRLDNDKSGFISSDDLVAFLGNGCSKEDADEIVRSADKNGDGKISWVSLFVLARVANNDRFTLTESRFLVFNRMSFWKPSDLKPTFAPTV
jgi:Ca2+-binding EF-hand superfamily protein